MIILGNNQIIGGKADTAAVINYAICADSIAAGADAFSTPADGVLGVAASSMLTAGAAEQLLIKSIHLFNTSASKVNVYIYLPSLTRQIYQALIPVNGSVVWTPDDGWRIYDMTGMPASYGVKTDGGTVGGIAGPFTLTFPPDGRMEDIFLDGVKQLSANYSISGTNLTFSGLTMTDYVNWAASYSF